MNIGFTYPNMYLAENYNSPQSVYWCLKTFIVLLIPEGHEFWTAPEFPHPLIGRSGGLLSKVHVVWPPRHILCNTAEHHYMLSSGQMTRKGHKGREAKYGKFAYSSAFGFSVPCGSLLEQMAPDSTLSASYDGESWRVRAEPVDERILQFPIFEGKSVPALASVWRPWRYLDLRISTTLVPLGEVYPGWHVRIHRIKWNSSGDGPWSEGIQLVDAGFAINAETACGGLISEVPSSEILEGYCVQDQTCLVTSTAGASGVVDLGEQMKGRTFVLKADPNTNLMASRTVIPAVEYSIKQGEDALLVTGVFGVAASADLGHRAVCEMWMNRPELSIDSLDIKTQ